jgi:hypothetical protein
VSSQPFDEKDVELLRFLHERFEHRYDTAPNVGFMRHLREIKDKIQNLLEGKRAENPEVALLKGVLLALLEMIPEHEKGCGVFSAHSSYGDTYCDCKMKETKATLKELINR